MKRAYLAFLLPLLLCLGTRLLRPLPLLKLDDFYVYYTAATLVHEGAGPRLYADAGNGQDPQLRIAATGSPMDVAAHSLGLPQTMLYLYPPLLADMLLPLTRLPLKEATRVWLALNVLFELGTWVCLVSLLRLRYKSTGSALIALGLFCFKPVNWCFDWGQVTIFLLFLWTFGVLLYAKKHTASSALVFALATAIKLTPLIIVIPFLYWREWRWLRVYALALAGFALLCLGLNTPGALGIFFTRIAPSMSRAIPELGNLSISAAVQILYTGLRGRAVFPAPTALSHPVMLFGKAFSVGLLVYVVLLIVRAGRGLRPQDRIMTLGLLSLLSPILAPVSWTHAYAMGFLAFALLWAEALQRPARTRDLVLLAASSAAFGSFALQFLVHALAVRGDGVFGATLLVTELLVTYAVIALRLHRMRETQPDLVLDHNSQEVWAI